MYDLEVKKRYNYVVDGLTEERGPRLERALQELSDVTVVVHPKHGLIEVEATREPDSEVRMARSIVGVTFRVKTKRRTFFEQSLSSEAVMSQSIRMTVYACLFAALMVVGTYIKIPVGPVPIVLANFFVILAGALLGSAWGAASVGIFLFLGLIGLPVFSQGGGVAALVGPTGGYLFGYLIAAYVTGVISEHARSKPLLDIAALVAGAVSIYLAGLPWLKLSLHLSWSKTIAVGFLPFLVGDALKVAAAVAVVRILQTTASSLFPVLRKRVSDE